MKYLVTGGAGFIGSNFVQLLCSEQPDSEVVNLDALTYAGNQDNLISVIDNPNHVFIHGNICDSDTVRRAIEGVDIVVNFAAETHVDRSIHNDIDFVKTNVMGTATLLAAALAYGVKRFIQVSTDEVYGELPWVDPDLRESSALRFTESTTLSPSSPYSATKAAADYLCLAYHATHDLNVIITRSSNNYGPNQHTEKFIPLMITRALQDRSLPVYGDGLHVRDWIYVRDHCTGLLAAIEKGVSGRVYNFGGNTERTNFSVVNEVLDILGCSSDLIRYVKDRPGHDRRYALDSSRAEEELGWRPLTNFTDGLRNTVNWYLKNPDWWRDGVDWYTKNRNWWRES